MSSVKFAPWSSDIELSFYSALASRKINHDKLDDAARKVLGRYQIRPTDPPERSARMQIHGNAFSTDEYGCRNAFRISNRETDIVRRLPADHYRAEGILRNVNTIEEFKNLDRNAIIERAGHTVRCIP